MNNPTKETRRLITIPFKYGIKVVDLNQDKRNNELVVAHGPNGKISYLCPLCMIKYPSRSNQPDYRNCSEHTHRIIRK